MRSQSRKTPRRKAKQDRSRQTIEVILEAAAQTLLREGYARATTNRLAARAGVSVGSIYQYFGDKDEIFDALIRRETDALVAQITEHQPDPAESLEQTMRELLLLAMRALRYGPDLFRALEFVPHARLRRRIAHGKRVTTTFVRNLLEQHRSELRVVDVDLAAHIVVNAAEAVAYNIAPEQLNERLVDEVTDLLARYLLAAPAATSKIQGTRSASKRIA